MKILPINYNLNMHKKNCISYKGKPDDNTINSVEGKSFDSFINWAKVNNFSENIDEILSDTNRIGEGQTAVVYKIPKEERWVIKKFKQEDITDHKNLIPNYGEIKDLIPELNVGQCICRFQYKSNDKIYDCRVLKKQRGIIHGIDFTASKDRDILMKFHAESLKRLADLPQISYKTLLRNINLLYKKGLCIDPYSRNFLIDTRFDSINIVDVGFDGSTEPYTDVLFALLNSSFGQKYKYLNGNKSLIADIEHYSDEIVKKYTMALKQNNIKFNNSNKLKQLYKNGFLKSITNKPTFEEALIDLEKQSLV